MNVNNIRPLAIKVDYVQKFNKIVVKQNVHNQIKHLVEITGNEIVTLK